MGAGRSPSPEFTADRQPATYLAGGRGLWGVTTRTKFNIRDLRKLHPEAIVRYRWGEYESERGPARFFGWWAKRKGGADMWLGSSLSAIKRELDGDTEEDADRGDVFWDKLSADWAAMWA